MVSSPMLHAEARRHTPPLALLVDRDDDTRSMYSEYLKQAHCHTDEAADGRDALAKAIARRPDVIVTETWLPGIDGFELCEILRRDSITRTIPIIVVTADGYASNTERARTAGADVVLIKPCLPELLLDEIHRVIEKSYELRVIARQVRPKVVSRTQNGSMARTHERRETTVPPVPPPELICPQCDRPLVYKHSNVGGVSARNSEQWDYYECSAGCGIFQYRLRTRKLRRVSG
jgi:two-component system cell cycle response regulator DivK